MEITGPTLIVLDLAGAIQATYEARQMYTRIAPVSSGGTGGRWRAGLQALGYSSFSMASRFLANDVPPEYSP